MIVTHPSGTVSLCLALLFIWPALTSAQFYGYDRFYSDNGNQKTAQGDIPPPTADNVESPPVYQGRPTYYDASLYTFSQSSRQTENPSANEAPDQGNEEPPSHPAWVRPTVSATKPEQMPPTSHSSLTTWPSLLSPVPSTSHPGPAENSIPQPPVYSDRTRSHPPVKRTDDLGLLDFDLLPAGMKKAFMRVDDLLQNRALIVPPGSAYRNIAPIFGEDGTLVKEELEPLVSDIEKVIVPGTYRTMSLVPGCCPILKFFAVNETLINLEGRERRVVHFSKFDPPYYQFLAHGVCASKTYDRNGHCHQGTSPISVLVYDLDYNPPFTFDLFELPSYCHCVHY